MNTINSMRAKLLHEKFGSNSASSFNEMVTKIMKMPSCIEKECCKRTVKNYPILRLNSETFNNDFNHLEQAIQTNFPDESPCDKCKKSPKLKRTFQPHILIEVKLLLLFFVQFHTYKVFHIFSFLYLDVFLGHK